MVAELAIPQGEAAPKAAGSTPAREHGGSGEQGYQPGGYQVEGNGGSTPGYGRGYMSRSAAGPDSESTGAGSPYGSQGQHTPSHHSGGGYGVPHSPSHGMGSGGYGARGDRGPRGGMGGGYDEHRSPKMGHKTSPSMQPMMAPPQGNVGQVSVGQFVPGGPGMPMMGPPMMGPMPGFIPSGPAGVGPFPMQYPMPMAMSGSPGGRHQGGPMQPGMMPVMVGPGGMMPMPGAPMMVHMMPGPNMRGGYMGPMGGQPAPPPGHYHHGEGRGERGGHEENHGGSGRSSGRPSMDRGPSPQPHGKHGPGGDSGAGTPPPPKN